MSRGGYICIIMLMLLILSCAKGTATDPTSSQLSENSNPVLVQVLIPEGRSLLGFHRVMIDTDAMEVTAVRLRSAQWHLNALKFVEPPDGESNLKFSGLEINGHKVGIDITVQHPFPALHYYSGFDVKGIVIGAADMIDPNDETRMWAGGPDGLRLLNADGWTRWWNPVEFPDNGTVFSHCKGKAGTDSSPSTLFATLSPYKVFAAALDPGDDLLSLVSVFLSHPTGRSVFLSSGVETRHYELVFPGDGSGGPDLMFDYALDASHGFPPDYVPGQYIEVPGGFPEDANQPEPFVLDVNLIANDVYLSDEGCIGGGLVLNLRVTDWQALINETPIEKEISSIELTSPTLFMGVRNPKLVSDWTPYEPWATYSVSLDGLTPDSSLDQQLLVTVISSEGDYQKDVSSYIGNSPLSSYYIVRVPVSTTGSMGETGFVVNPLSTWPKPGGNNSNNNYMPKAIGPGCPEIAWRVDNLSSDIWPVVDPDGRVFLAKPYEDYGVTLMMFDPNGYQLAEINNDQFNPAGSPVLVGCSLYWNDIEGRVIKLTENGNYNLVFTPMSGVGPVTFGMLNIDDAGHGFVHGPASLQSFNDDGELLWARFGIEGAPSRFIGPPTVAGDGRIIIGKEDIDTTPPSNFRFWALNAETGEIEWSHDPGIDGKPYGTCADSETGQVYYVANNHVVALFEETGVERWEYEAESYLLNQTAIGPNHDIYAAESVPGQTGGTSRLLSINQDGQENWDYECDNGISAGPIVDVNGNIYIAGTDGAVRCFGDDGSLRWLKVVDGYPCYITFADDFSLLVGLDESSSTASVVCLKD